MKRQVILFIAQSLDGYIAKPDFSVDFLMTGDPIEPDHEYDKLMAQVDTVIMGKTTYDQLVTELSPTHYPYANQESYVLTSHPEDVEATGNRHFMNTDPVALVQQLKSQPGRSIWIVGGSSLITPLVNAGLIDRYQIAVVPVILGDGIPLFSLGIQPTTLNLVDAFKINEIAYLTYQKKGVESLGRS
ncbi:dihydrofolate reductase family protein [Levilactobacillus bambusae]|uniref:Dihydrofolate reductase n=1 Tax=Levilactobacillus bambusae TaxID=2024736 RepID=A0A2V1MZG2_9LACO|nr:dihydrofolate reductase family protein [Levilactobacillus bambusae]PWG00401.1 dihydrofolate reductase [Levilactobacillus bambusae]